MKPPTRLLAPMRWTLALLALFALLLAVPTVMAARTNTVVLTFPDAHTAEVMFDLTATDTEASAVRSAMDLNRNGVVDGLDLEWDAQCAYSIPEDQQRVRFKIDNYDLAPAFVSCEHETARGTVDGAPLNLRKTLRFVSPMRETRMATAYIDGPVDVSFNAPVGKEIILSGDASLVARSTTQLAGSVPHGPPRTAVMRFPYASQPLDFGYSTSAEQTITITEPDLVRQELTRTYEGYAAQMARVRADTNRDGVVNEQEIAAARTTALETGRDYLGIDGVDRGARIVGYDVFGAMGPVSYEGTVSLTFTNDVSFDLPRQGFRLDDYISEEGVFIVRAPHRQLTHVSGLTAPAVIDDGHRIYGSAASMGRVVIDVGPTTYVPPSGATSPEEMAPGAWTRTTSVGLYGEGPATMRWSIADHRTAGAGRDFRTSLDSDADNQVGADELASFEAGVRLVPGPAAWPFTLDGAQPTATRVHSVEITGLAGAYNSPDDVRTTVVYEADFARSTGVLRAAALDYGDRVGVVAPYGVPLDAAGATGLRDVVAGLDGSTLQGVPGDLGWSVRVGAAPAPATPTAAPTGPTPAGPTPTGATPTAATTTATCAPPAEPGTQTSTWTVTFSAPERIGVRIEQVATGARAAASRAVVDTDRDCVVLQAEADVIGAGNAREELLRNIVAFDGRPPTTIAHAMHSIEGYAGAANRADAATYLRSYVATFDASPPAELVLSAPGARVVVVPPAGHVVQPVQGFASSRVEDGRLTGEARRDVDWVTVRILPATLERAAEEPTPAEIATAAPLAPAPAAPTDERSETTGTTDTATGTGAPPEPEAPAPTSNPLFEPAAPRGDPPTPTSAAPPTEGAAREPGTPSPAPSPTPAPSPRRGAPAASAIAVLALVAAVAVLRRR